MLGDGHVAMGIRGTPVNCVVSVDVAVKFEVGFIGPGHEARKIRVLGVGSGRESLTRFASTDQDNLHLTPGKELEW